jgi:hypothetical protein
VPEDVPKRHRSETELAVRQGFGPLAEVQPEAN